MCVIKQYTELSTEKVCLLLHRNDIVNNSLFYRIDLVGKTKIFFFSSEKMQVYLSIVVRPILVPLTELSVTVSHLGIDQSFRLMKYI